MTWKSSTPLPSAGRDPPSVHARPPLRPHLGPPSVHAPDSCPRPGPPSVHVPTPPSTHAPDSCETNRSEVPAYRPSLPARRHAPAGPVPHLLVMPTTPLALGPHPLPPPDVPVAPGALDPQVDVAGRPTTAVGRRSILCGRGRVSHRRCRVSDPWTKEDVNGGFGKK